MKRLLGVAIGSAALLIPTLAFARDLPAVACEPAALGAVCMDGVPRSLLRSDLQCSLCNEGMLRTASNRSLRLCDALHSLPLLSEFPSCEQLATATRHVDSMLATNHRSAM